MDRFYNESVLIWLDADVTIRRESRGARSLDDFCRRFAGAPGGEPTVVPHSLDDVLRALHEVQPYDWRGFLAARIDSVAPRAPLGGIENGGWTLAWTDTASAAILADEKAWDYVGEPFTLGRQFDKDGKITDVLSGSPASAAGIAPGTKPTAVNGRRFSIERLRAELKASKDRREPVELIGENGDFVRTFAIDWHGGTRYPTLQRDPSKPDLLGEILRPRTPIIAPEPQGGR